MAKRTRKKKLRFLLPLLVIFLLAVIAGLILYKNWLEGNAKFVRYPAFGIPIPEKYSIHGIDVSRYQETISWESVAEMEIKNVKLGFSFIKATEGIGNIDKHFRRNWKRAKDAGIIRGAYHFFLATKDGRAQAEHFIKRVKLDKGDLPPVVDVEQTYGVPAPVLKSELKEWLLIVKEHYGVKPIIYTNVDFYKRYLGKDFDEYPLWAAHYFEYNEPRINRSWSFWQHSEQGRVNGIISRVDFNVFNGDSIEFRSMLIP